MLGDNSPTYCGDAYREPSVLDLTLVHNTFSLRLSRRVGDDAWRSDHLPIFIDASIVPGANRL